MKRKSALLVIICLFLGAFFSQLSAQASQGWFSTSDFGFEWRTEVYCDGIQADYVVVEARVHIVFHPGGPWQMMQVKGTATSLWTGEEFKYKEKDQKDFFNAPATVHVNLKGNQGNHYIGSMTIDFSGGAGNEIFTPIHMVCN